MIRKVSVVVSFAALAALAASMRGPQLDLAAPPTSQEKSKAKPEDHPALASYRVFESTTESGAPSFRGVGYDAVVTESGLHYRAGGWRMTLRGASLEQGGETLDLSHAPAERTQWATAQVRRAETVVEEYLFENRRVEQLFRIAEPIATSGALTVRVAVETDLTGPVEQVKRSDKKWKDLVMADGGLSFSDGMGVPRLAYHGAVAIDAKGRRQPLDPRWDNGQIAMEVPASYMKDAAYPVIVDPWLEMDFSATSGGLSQTGTVSEAPSVQVGPSGFPHVAWTENVGGNAEIYYRLWNGFDWFQIGNSATGGGVSNTTGRSANPYLCLQNGTAIAWEDDSEVSISIFLKKFDGVANSWIEVAGSASAGNGGVSGVAGPNTNPSVVSVPGIANNTLIGSIDVAYNAYLVAWENGSNEIMAAMSFIGDDRGNKAGWHPLVTNGTPLVPAYVVSNTPVGTSARPVMALDRQNRPVIAWEDTVDGEHDIYVARYTDMSPAVPVNPFAFTPFFYVAELVGGQTRMCPVDDGGGVSPNIDCGWQGVDGSMGVRGICGAGGIPANQLSIQPSIAVDSSDNIYVAWQESDGTGEREIYLLTNAGGGGWVEIDGSATLGGISNTTTVTPGLSSSSAPSLGVGGGTIVVAWEEDVDGDTEINVRANVGTGWAQVGDEGSASPYPAEVGFNTGGISRNTTFSMQPRVAVASDGSAAVAWRDGLGSTFDIFVRRFHFNQPLNLRQQFVDASAATIVLSPGGVSSSTVVQLIADIDQESIVASLTNKVHVEFECRRIDTPFNGHFTLVSDQFVNGTTVTAFFSGLPNANYHWQARTIDEGGRSSPWIGFGANADGQTDFGVDTATVGSGGPNTGGSGSSKDKCGLLGAEVLLAFALAAALRRRKA